MKQTPICIVYVEGGDLVVSIDSRLDKEHLELVVAAMLEFAKTYGCDMPNIIELSERVTNGRISSIPVPAVFFNHG